MKIKEPEFRYGDNWQELANLFGYDIKIDNQDWTYIVAEPNRIDEYIQAYDITITNEDTKFSLMEMIIQSLTGQKDQKIMIDKWKLIKPILDKDFELHQYTIYYWCCWDNDDVNDCWEVTPLMRDYWIKKK